MMGKLISAGALFLFTLISGMVLSRSGRPLGIGLVTVHKFLALGVMVLIGMVVYRTMKAMDNVAALKMAAVVVSAALFLALIATGGFLTREELQLPAYVLKMHQAASLLSLVLSPLTVLLVLSGRG